MTRRKWIRLRRQRPDLFNHPLFKWNTGKFAYERLSIHDWGVIRKYSKGECISRITAYLLKRL